MKKTALLLALLLLLTACLTACGKKETAETETVATTEETTALAGGWTLSDDMTENISDYEKEVFEKALEGFAGVGYRPIALLGTQVVAGINYAFLCEATTVTATPVTKLAVVIVYADLEGNASIKNVKDFSLADYTQEDISLTTEQLSGGWTANEAAPEKMWTGEIGETYDKALNGLVGKSYYPVELLGTQVVAGRNYAFLCRSTLVTANPVTNMSIVTIYADLEGNAQIKTIADIDIASFNE